MKNNYKIPPAPFPLRVLGVSPLLTIIIAALFYNFANIDNWRLLEVFFLIFSVISIFLPWFDKRPFRQGRYNLGPVIKSKFINNAIRISLSIIFFLASAMAVTDLLSGSSYYEGPCRINYSGGGSKGLIIQTNNETQNIFITYNDFKYLAGNRIGQSNYNYECNSDIKLVYLKNLNFKLDLQKVEK